MRLKEFETTIIIMEKKWRNIGILICDDFSNLVFYFAIVDPRTPNLRGWRVQQKYW